MTVLTLQGKVSGHGVQVDMTGGRLVIDAASPHQRTNPNDLNRPNNDVRPIKPEQREKEMQIEKEKQQLERQQRTNSRRPLRRQNN